MDKLINNSDLPRVLPRRRPLGRVWAVALVTLRQGLRMRLWILVLPALAVLVVGDLSSPRFDPVFEAVPAAVSMSLLVMAVLAVVVGIFFATYSLPAEMESKVAQSIVTKPVGRTEFVAGKTLGMSLLVAALVGLVGLGGYVYILVRASEIKSAAGLRLEEAVPHAAFPADVNALQAVAARGPLPTFRYLGPGAGPDLGIDMGPAKPAGPETRWILSETGMRMTWNLAETPVREWAAAGPVGLRLALRIERPADVSVGPAQVVIFLVPVGAELPREAEPGQPIRQEMLDAAESGVLEIPVAAPDAPPVKGTLNVPLEGDLVLHLFAQKPGFLIGAQPASLRIIGPAGQQFVVPAPPEVLPSQVRNRTWLAGRSQLPRQAASFAFHDVQPRWLGDEDTAVELGFSMDAWAPATVQPAAEVTFVRPDGQELAMKFTPESHHSTVVYLDRAFWHGGPLQVQLRCLTDDDSLGLVPESVRLRLAGGPFAWNFAKAVARVWLFGTIIAAAGVLVSTRLSWFVSILAASIFFVIGMSHDFVIHSTAAGWLATTAAQFAHGHLPWSGWNSLADHVLVPLPDLRAQIPGPSVSMGQVMPWAELGEAFGWAALSVSIMVLVGGWIFRRREVAA